MASPTSYAEAAVNNPAVNEPATSSTALLPPAATATVAAPAALVATTSVAPAATGLTPTATGLPPTTTSVLRIAIPQVDDLNLGVAGETRIQAPNPVTIRIPRIQVEAPIIPLGLQDDGTIEVPERPEDTGWWLGGPEPGEPGPAVIIGHVDSTEGPAVFFHLRYLKPGDEIQVDREDGSTLSYVVEHSERHAKNDFPTDEVYGPTEQPTLRLVTCGGDYDFDVRTYPDNVIVFASLA